MFEVSERRLPVRNAKGVGIGNDGEWEKENVGTGPGGQAAPRES